MERPQIFSVDDPEGYLAHLEEHGYAVIGNVLQDEIRNELIDQFWSDWTRCSPGFDRNSKETWTIQNCPMMFAKGMALFSGLPHSDFAWKTRTQPAIKRIFENIHGTDKLVVSFDGFSVFFDKKQKPGNWWHVDQHPDNPEYCIQGQYNFLPVNEDSAGFVLVPGSHKTQLQTNAKKDWVPIENVQGGVKLLIPENCFTLWNSRTIHANTGMTCKQKRFDRLTCYITYMPKSSRSKEVRFQRILAYMNGDGTSHWANRCEVKKYPWGFGPTYESRGFIKLQTRKTEIPKEWTCLF